MAQCSVDQHGAVADGRRVCTAAFAAAIDACGSAGGAVGEARGMSWPSHSAGPTETP